MLTQIIEERNRQRVHDRIRKKVQGTAERPRLNVYRSLNHIYVQVIDDLQGRDPGFGQLRRGQEGKRRPAETWRRRRMWARRSPSAPRRKESPKLCSIAAATFITGG